MKKTIRKIELLAPAGDLERLKTAVIFGADAVYCGLPSWSLRNAREITFTLKTLEEGIKFAHDHGKKIYITFNIFAHESQLKKVEEDLKKIKGLDFDGIIVSDLGMFNLVKKHLPKIEIHISTQANTLNSEAVKMWGKLGAKRVVLARELTLEEIKKIKKTLNSSPSVGSTGSPQAGSGRFRSTEIEVFGHGAMCMAYSGRCLLSKYFTGREANLGDCAQSCRWKYKIKNQDFFLEEETRPGDLIEVQEDPNGTYFMNSKEICSIDIIDKFIEAGIDSLKIEGRAKTVYYLATVVGVYRRAIDAYYAGKFNKKLVKELFAELNLVQNRGYSHGFLTGRHDYEQEYNIAAYKPPVIFLGVFINNESLVEVKNKFKVGDDVEIVTPPSTLLGTSNKVIKAKVLEIKTEHGKIIEEILKPAERVWVKFDLKEKIPERSILRKILIK